MLDFNDETKIRFSLRDKRLFEIIEVEITRVDCILLSSVVIVCHCQILFAEGLAFMISFTH